MHCDKLKRKLLMNVIVSLNNFKVDTIMPSTQELLVALIKNLSATHVSLFTIRQNKNVFKPDISKFRDSIFNLIILNNPKTLISCRKMNTTNQPQSD